MHTDKSNSEEKEDMIKSEKNGNLTIRRNKTVDFIAKIGCLIIAFFIWFYAVKNDTALYEEYFSSIPVDIVNQSGFSVLSGDDVTVDVTLSGKRSVINRISASDIRAFIDMSSITSAGKYKFDVQYELPNGVSLVKSTSNSITVYADNTSSVSVPVITEITNFMLEDGYELGRNDITTDIQNVTVTGPESVISQIEYAKISADIGHVTRTVTYSGNISLVDSFGNTVTNSYIKTNVSYVTATIPVYKYRDVPITVTYKYGYFDDQNVTVSVDPMTVRVKGEADAVDAVRLQYEIDEKKISGDTSYTVSIMLPDGVKNVNAVEAAVISIELKGISSRILSVYNISVINPDGIAYEPITGPINITVQGDAALVSRINSMSITATVDLTSQGSVSGTAMVPVSFVFSSPYAGKVYEVGTYSVSVKINP